MNLFKYKKIILIAVVAALFVAFIWSNSCKSPEESAVQSGAVVDFLRTILNPNGKIPEAVFHHYVRKAAHFVEYALLGALIGGLFRLIFRKFGWAFFALSVVMVLLVAVLDESIQRFTGRGSAVKDVLLDVYSGIFGLGIVWLTGMIKKKK